MISKEHLRLTSSTDVKGHPWRQWGPYVSERAWGTVREDYSGNGDAWNYFPHDMARSRAYRWSEDGIAGFSDIYQTVVCSFAFWNEQDPILKERLFGLTPFEGNHGEDVKEYYYYLDATPTHSYMKYLYKYPQKAFPYQQLIEENKKRGTKDREFELVDTGVFDEDRYFDIFIEYAKEGPKDICIQVTVWNRGPEDAPIHVLPHIFFRNRWSWIKDFTLKAEIKEDSKDKEGQWIYINPEGLHHTQRLLQDYSLDPFYFVGPAKGESLFTNNDTNQEKLYGAQNSTPFVKDAFHRFIINKENCVNPDKKGTKAAIHYKMVVPSKKSITLQFRLCPDKKKKALSDVSQIIEEKRKEADEFYDQIHPKEASKEDRMIQRQAFAGMLWSKQFYRYNVKEWLSGDPCMPPPPPSHKCIRNFHWTHLNADNVISMPDKWEYPWFAAWDLSFHTVALAGVDMQLAKHQLHLLLEHHYQHPNGQIPAYEWSFSDLNPPVQAWALWRLYCMDGRKDLKFLEMCFMKLIMNYSWWVNKVDKKGNNVFEGGFLGLDNISIFDRSNPIFKGTHFEESDGTGWMAFYSLMMVRIALEFAKVQHYFGELATTFLDHFFSIAKAMQQATGREIGMWSEEDGLFYDVINTAGGEHKRLNIHSFVGIIPLYAVDYVKESDLKAFPKLHENFHLYLKESPDLMGQYVREIKKDGETYYLFSLMNENQMAKMFHKLFDHEEFFSPYGLRSLSKFHEKNPYHFHEHVVCYEPGESLERIKGGNSNWRGPIWFPTNLLVLDALTKLHRVVGDVQYGGELSLRKMIKSLKNNLVSLFREDGKGNRPIFGDTKKMQEDPHFKNYLHFYEHYHGDSGRGLGASHQTGWSGVVATIISELNFD